MNQHKAEEEYQLALGVPATFSYANKLLLLAGQKHYLSEELADFHFTFDSGERVPAHKVLLSASDVFQTMFNGSWKELKEVKIVDATADVFKEFLQIFYLEDVKMTTKNADEVMELANTYDATECFNACLKMFLADLGARRIVKMDVGQLSFLKSSTFLQCSKQVLGSILKQDSMNCSEAELFKAVMSWVRAKTKQNHLTEEIIRAELDDLFYEFRFRSMTMKEFVDLIPAYGQIFTKDDLQEIIQMIVSEDFEPRSFNANIRCADGSDSVSDEFKLDAEDESD